MALVKTSSFRIKKSCHFMTFCWRLESKRSRAREKRNLKFCALGAKYLVFVSSRFVKTRELCTVCILFEESVFIFQFLYEQIHNYFKQNIIVNFIIKKLKNKHTFLKKYTYWAKLSSLFSTEQEEKKTRYFAPMAQNMRILFSLALDLLLSSRQQKVIKWQLFSFEMMKFSSRKNFALDTLTTKKTKITLF